MIHNARSIIRCPDCCAAAHPGTARMPRIPPLLLQDLQAAVGFPEYYREEERYRLTVPPSSSNGTGSSSAAAGVAGIAAAAAAAAAAEPAGVEADIVLEPGSSTPASPLASTGTIDLYGGPEEGSRGRQYGARSAREAEWLRLRITDSQVGA